MNYDWDKTDCLNSLDTIKNDKFLNVVCYKIFICLIIIFSNNMIKKYHFFS